MGLTVKSLALSLGLVLLVAAAVGDGDVAQGRPASSGGEPEAAAPGEAEAAAPEPSLAREPVPHPELLSGPYSLPKTPAPGAVFYESFEDEAGVATRWVASSNDKYNGRMERQTASYAPIGSAGDHMLVIPEASRFYGVSTRLPSPFKAKEGAPTVFQYEVKLQEGLECGGAYFKLFRAPDDGEFSPVSMHADSPYTIMFGPDKCGSNKVHFILQHKSPITGKWEEKHHTSPAFMRTDKETHLYTLVIHPDNEFEIRIDGAVVKTGNLLTDMKPPVNPPAEIDDPNDTKPADWVDDPMMDDPSAAKPDDWDEDAPPRIDDPEDIKPDCWQDDTPAKIADPSAVQPADWNAEDDGAWAAPLIANPACEDCGCGPWSPAQIRNPAYKGKWRAPRIENPAYKGEWKPAQIPNPEFFEDKTPADFAPIVGLGLELWTTSSGLSFDNVWLGHDLEAAQAWANATFVPKHENEAHILSEDRRLENAEREARENAPLARALRLWDETVTAATKNPVITAGVIVAAVLPLIALLVIRGGAADPQVAEAKAALAAAAKAKKTDGDDAAADENGDDDDDDDDDDDTAVTSQAKVGGSSAAGLKKRKGKKVE